ncbi:hypothetical protein [Streptomyces sioyaensis]|uniref:hypothetical protein n=1 Tax=Streptomyces sioyaensis TaxID=67364 RepID=UPI003D726D75
MDAVTALKRLTFRAETAFEREATARQRLTEALANPQAPHLDSAMGAVLTEAGIAKPWDQFMRRVEKIGVSAALAKQREEAIEQLLQYGHGMSTSLISNAKTHAELEGLRRFITSTDNFADEIEDEAPAPAPEATDVEKRTLRAIKDTGVALKEAHVLDGGIRTENREGTIAPALDRVQWVIRKGWAVLDASAELRDGQAVTLTEAGEAILAG